MKKVILKIGGMSCSACSSGLEKYLNKQEGIHASINLVLAQALIEYDDSLTVDDLNQYIKEAGFESLGIYDPKKIKKTSSKKTFYIFTFLAIIILYISMAHMIHLPNFSFLNMNEYPKHYAITLLILTIPFFYYGKEILISGYKNIIHKTPNMDTLVSIGVIASFSYSLFGTIMIFLNHNSYVHHLYFESAAIVIYFLKLGRFIDQKSKEKTSSAIEELVQITPTKALLKIDNTEKEVTIDEVNIGDILIAKPGMKIAVDGIITKGFSHLDQAFLTGESTPVKKEKNDSVIAGSVNLDGYIEYKAEKIGADSTISEIVRLVTVATNTKAPISHLADQVSLYFVPTIMILSILTFVISLLVKVPLEDAFNSFVSILVVACPCALGLATPLAIVVSIGICARKGILIKTSKILEKACQIDTIVFDKTGTLTYGNSKIASRFFYHNYQELEVLKLVASLEQNSTHPISRAFLESAKEKNIELQSVENFTTIPGIGLKGVINKQTIYVGNEKLFRTLGLKNTHEKDQKQLAGNTIVYVVLENEVIALFGISDIIRNNAKSAISKLQHLKKEVIMLTGDNLETALKIADELNIQNVIANVLPTEKANVIKKLQATKNVMMVGDGINDAPSLASADLSVGLNSGTDIAANSSDVILMNDDLDKIATLLTISKKTLRNIKQNLFWAFFYNVCMIPIAMGLLKPFHISLNPMIAGGAMMISSFTVILNALRLKNHSNQL